MRAGNACHSEAFDAEESDNKRRAQGDGIGILGVTSRTVRYFLLSVE
jgi:hypothetical protein